MILWPALIDLYHGFHVTSPLFLTTPNNSDTVFPKLVCLGTPTSLIDFTTAKRHVYLPPPSQPLWPWFGIYRILLLAENKCLVAVSLTVHKAACHICYTALLISLYSRLASGTSSMEEKTTFILCAGMWVWVRGSLRLSLYLSFSINHSISLCTCTWGGFFYFLFFLLNTWELFFE